jgi:hypothetical protein
VEVTAGDLPLSIDSKTALFLTNDPIFRRITSLEVLILDEHV